jgi:RecA-family ATPase
VSDWLARAGMVRADHPRLQGQAVGAGSSEASRFGAIQWADLDSVSVRQDWLIEDMMFCGDVGMVYGASGSGKSFLMTHAGLCIARGVPFLGHATRKGAVIYQAGEGGKGLVKRLRPTSRSSTPSPRKCRSCSSPPA